MECVSNCIRTYDPLSDNYLGGNRDLVAKGALTTAGGMFGKRWIGLRVGAGGATPVTSFPSVVSHAIGGRKTKFGSGMRSLGRGVSGFWLGYGIYLFAAESHCAYACASYRCSY